MEIDDVASFPLRPVIPLMEGDKYPPLLKGWQNATEEELNQVLEQAIQDKGLKPNIGLRLDNFLVIDPDDEAAVGFLEELEEEGLLPPTLTWRTWRGFPIRCYLAKEGVKPRKYHNGIRFEVRTGSGQYCVVPPSLVKGKEYTLTSPAEPAFMPALTLAEIEARLAGKGGGGLGEGEGGGHINTNSFYRAEVTAGDDLQTRDQENLTTMGCSAIDDRQTVAGKSSPGDEKRHQVGESVTSSGERHRASPELQVVTPSAIMPALDFRQGSRNDSAFSVALSLFMQGYSPENVWKVLEAIGAASQPTLAEKELITILRSAQERSQRKERNYATEIEAWVRGTSGAFYSAELDRELNLTSKREKANRRMAIKRLLDQDIITRVGTKQGLYRLLEDDLEEIDILNVDTTELPLSLPFDLHKQVKILGKSLIVVAGAPNAGKTAWLLDLACRNMNNPKLPKIHYFTSEMTAEELRDRLQLFQEFRGLPVEEWCKGVKFYERTSNFVDVIRRHPDDINIIDYFELHTDFWTVGEDFRKIFDNLNQGIAVIALQKKKGEAYGRGGAFTHEKPRLNIALDYNEALGLGEMSITKAKVRRDHQRDINGVVYRFKLMGGCKFIPQGEPFRKGQNKETENE